MRFSSQMAHIKGADEERFAVLGSSTEKTLAIPRLKELPTPRVICCYPILILLLPSQDKQQLGFYQRCSPKERGSAGCTPLPTLFD